MSVVARFSARTSARIGRVTPALVAVAAGTMIAAGPVHAAPADLSQLPTASEPMPAGPGEYSYIATRSATKNIASMKVPDAIASLPVPAQYRPANMAMAAQFDKALTAALRAPGGCLQVVVDPRARSGNLFNYGFFPVAGKYCS